jgi:hypothetical protein
LDELDRLLSAIPRAVKGLGIDSNRLVLPGLTIGQRRMSQ